MKQIKNKKVFIISGVIVCFVFLAVYFISPVFTNIWFLLTDNVYFIPDESNIIKFRVMDMNSGSGDWWIYGEDNKYYYYYGDIIENHPLLKGNKYYLIEKEKTKMIDSFDPLNFNTWKIELGLDDYIEVPEFKIAVKLSEKAQKKLEELNETIIVIAYFDGDGEEIPGQKTAPFRNIYLGSAEKEIKYGEVALFDGVKIFKKDYNRLSSTKYYVTINVVSGRKAYKDNLLDIVTHAEPIEFFAGQEIIVNGKLIEE